ncbi:hypothetical protein GOP47_0029621, partial [Adiantum capillus-veneris]
MHNTPASNICHSSRHLAGGFSRSIHTTKSISQLLPTISTCLHGEAHKEKGNADPPSLLSTPFDDSPRELPDNRGPHALELGFAYLCRRQPIPAWSRSSLACAPLMNYPLAFLSFAPQPATRWPPLPLQSRDPYCQLFLLF